VNSPKSTTFSKILSDLTYCLVLTETETFSNLQRTCSQLLPVLTAVVSLLLVKQFEAYLYIHLFRNPSSTAGCKLLKDVITVSTAKP